MKSNINWDKFNNFAGYVIAAFTDDYIVGVWQEEKELIYNKRKLLLELRVFNEDMEYKYCRGNIGEDEEFFTRVKNNDELEEYFDEEQFLDIDEKRSVEVFKNEHRVVPTKGNKSYYMPLDSMADAKIIIRHYISRDAGSGQAYISDWRCVGFKKGE